MKRKLTKRQRENIRDGTKAAMYRLRVQDRRASRIAPFGYRFSADGKGIEVDESEQAIIEDLKMIDAGNNYHEIARQLNEKGLKPRSGRQWYPSTVRSVVLRMQRVKEERAHWLALQNRIRAFATEPPEDADACSL